MKSFKKYSLRCCTYSHLSRALKMKDCKNQSQRYRAGEREEKYGASLLRGHWWPSATGWNPLGLLCLER